jgi:phage shock protein A
MIDRTLSPKEVRQLQERYQKLQSEIAQLGWIAQGSLMHKEPNAWRLTRKIKAKTTTLALSKAQASLFAQAIANHRRLEELLQQMRDLSQLVLLGSVAGVKKRPRKNIPNRP